MIEKDKLYELIVRELSSEISENEKEILEKEISNNPDSERKFIFIKEFWTKFFPKSTSNKIIEKTENKLDFTYQIKSRINSRFIFRIAASILIILSFSYSGYHFFKPEQTLVLNDYSSGPEQVKELTLSDGTKVWLNSMSFLFAAEPFNGDFREVKLVGEAYFEVAHNPEQPFVVQTPQLKTKVLGTHFNIVAYPTDKYQEISLYEGEVNLQAEDGKNTSVSLKPGERAFYSSVTGELNIIKTDLGKPASWRENILHFYDEDFYTITKKLERKFQTRIYISDIEVGKLRFTAEFDVEPLEIIMELLNAAHTFKFEITDDGIIIQSAKK